MLRLSLSVIAPSRLVEANIFTEVAGRQEQPAVFDDFQLFAAIPKIHTRL